MMKRLAMMLGLMIALGFGLSVPAQAFQWEDYDDGSYEQDDEEWFDWDDDDTGLGDGSGANWTSDDYGSYDSNYDWNAADDWFDDWYGDADQDWDWF